MMRYAFILVFSLFALDSFGQIRDNQLGHPPNGTDQFFMGIDTAGVFDDRGKWIHKDSMPFGRLDTVYVTGDSLCLVSVEGDTVCFQGGGDLDWIKYGTASTVPNNTDTMYHNGYVTIGSDTALTGILNVIGRIDARFPDATGQRNLAIGANSGYNGSGFQFNTALGHYTLSNASSGTYNMAVGDSALHSVTSGDFNLGIGSRAGRGITTGLSNVAIGNISLYGGAAFGNVAIGASTGLSGVTSFNTLIGYLSGGNGTPVSNNTFIGAFSGFNATGSGNVFIGRQSGYNETGNNLLYIENSTSASPLVLGDFSADSVLINGELGFTTDAGNPDRLAGLLGTQFTSAVVGYGLEFSNDTINVDTSVIGSGGGDDWGSDVVNTDLTLTGDGTVGDVLKVDTTIITTFADTLETLATQYDLTLLTGDGNGIFDATNEGGTVAVNIASVTNAGFYFDAASNGSYWGYEPADGRMIMYSDQADDIITLQNNHASQGTFLNLFGGANQYRIGAITTGDFYIQDGSIEPFYIEAATTVDNSLKIHADGNIQIADYPNTRDDGTPTNVLGTDANGEIQSYPVADVQTTDTYATIEVNGSGVSTNAPTLDFDGTDFSVSESPTDNFDITIQPERIQDLVGAMVTGNTETGITVTYQDGDGTIDFVATDASATNELNTIEENNSTVQSSNSTLDFQTLFDVAPDGAGEVNISLDLSEATTVTTPEADDWVIMHDAGLSQHQKILWSDLYDLIIEAAEPDGNGIFDATNDGSDVGNSTYDVGIPGYLNFESNLLYLSGTLSRIGIGTSSPTFDVHIVGTQGALAIEPASSGGTATLKLEGTSDGGGGNTNQANISMNYTDTDYSGAEQTGMLMSMNKVSDLSQWTNFRMTMPEATDADVFVSEKQGDFSNNTTESHIAFNGGVAFTQNYEWTSTSGDLDLDRSYNIVNVSGAGGTGNEINLPEVASTSDNWDSALTSIQAQVGQEFTITNFRSATNLIVRAFSGDQIDASGSTTVTIAPHESIIIKCVRWSSGVGYWKTYN